MDCTEILENVERHALGALSVEDAAAVEQHLAACPSCRAEAERVQRRIDGFRRSMRADAAQDLALPHLRQRIRQEVWKSRVRERAWRLGRVAAVLLAAAGLFGLWSALRGAGDGGPCVCTPWARHGIASRAGSGSAYPVVTKRQVLALAEEPDGSHLLVMDRRTGARLWKTAFPVAGCPSLDARRVYAWSEQGAGRIELVALDGASGAPVWRRAVADSRRRPSAPQVVVANRLVCWSEGGAVEALDARTGAPLWTRAVPREGLLSAPSVSPDRLYVASGKALYALDPADGRVLWRRPHDRPGMPLAKPFVEFDGRSVVAAIQTADGRGWLQCCSAENGESRWQQETDAPRHLLAYRGRVYLRGARIQAFDGQTGSRVWSVPVGGCSPVVMGNDRIYVSEGRERKGILALRADTGQTIWHRPLLSSCSGLTVAGRMGYVCAQDGSLHAVVLETDHSYEGAGA